MGLRVCFVSSYPPSRGRLAEYAHYLVSSIKRCPEIRHIDVITNQNSNSPQIESEDKVTVRRVWKAEKPMNLFLMPLRIFKTKPDIVHFNLHMAVFGKSRIVNFIGLSIPFLCRLLGLKTVVTLHNVFDNIDIEKTGFRNNILNRMGAMVITKLLAMGSALTVTVKSYVNLLKKRYDCKNVVWIPHGTSENNSSENHKLKRKETILYIGHSGPYKDLDTLFKTFELLKQKRKSIRLIVAGTSHPNYPDFLQKWRENIVGKEYEEDVKFWGYVPEKELAPLFEDADVVVCPYRTCTGTSGVAHLASSFGTPIVATNLPEFRDLVESGCGILLSPLDPEALAENIQRVLDDKNLVYELRERNLSFSRERSWTIVASQLCQVYTQLAET